MKELADHIVTGLSPGQLLFALIWLAVGTVGMVGVLVPALARHILPPIVETRLVDFVRMKEILSDGSTIRCSDGTLVGCVRLAGKPLGALSEAERKRLLGQRHALIRRLAGKPVTVRIFTRRQRVSLDYEASQGTGLAGRLMAIWHKQFRRSFVTDHVVVLSVKSSAFHEARSVLEEGLQDVLQLLKDYEPQVLRHDETASDLFGFWAEVVNPAHRGAVPGPASAVAHSVVCGGSVEIEHRSGLLYFGAGAEQERYGYFLAIGEWGEAASQELVPRLLSLDCELTISHRFRVLSKIEAQLRAKHEGDLNFLVRANPAARAEQDLVLEFISPESSAPRDLVAYEMTVLVLGDTADEARIAVDHVRSTLADFGIRCGIDTFGAQAAYFGQLPGYDHMTRRIQVLSTAVAELFMPAAQPRGFDRSDWGHGPTMVLATESGTPYQFNFHVSPRKEEVAHTCLIGATGSGKSVSLAMMMTSAMARHPNLRIYAMDRQRGLLTWCRSMGGTYYQVQSDLPGLPAVHLQPLQLELNAHNKAHIQRWLRLLVGETDMESETCYAKVLDLLPLLPRALRSLETVKTCFPSDSVAGRKFQQWVENGPYAGIYSHDVEEVATGGFSGRLSVFDLTHVLEDPVVAPPFVDDLFYRIRADAEEHRAPGIVVVDEAPLLLRNKLFRESVERIALEGRKARLAIVLLMQHPRQIEEIDPALGELIRSQFPTTIFIPNGQVQAQDRAVFTKYGISDREFDFIRGRFEITEHMRHPLLVKRARESVFVEIDHGILGDLSLVFQSGEEFSRAYLEAAAAYDDPQMQLERYLDAATAIRRHERSGREREREGWR